MKLSLSPIFTNGAVFAANRPVRVFGEGDGHIAIEFLGARRELDTNGGNWCIEFESQPYGGPYEMTVTLDSETTVLQDLWIGEVLLLSGQSNIELRMHECKDYPEISEPCPSLRVFHAERVDQKGYLRPMHGWKHCDNEDTIRYTSAIGYETGLLLAKARGCAVGLLSASQGASVIQSWLPEGTLDRIGLHFTKEEMSSSHFKYSLWNPPGKLYNTMFKPWTPYSISNVIWYQGESNACPAEGAAYKKMLAELIRIWRDDLQNSALPFTVIQIADYDVRLKDGPGWKLIQDAQMEIQDEVSYVTTVICRDVCETDNIHPPTKRYLSERVAKVLLNQ